MYQVCGPPTHYFHCWKFSALLSFLFIAVYIFLLEVEGAHVPLLVSQAPS